MKIRPVEAEFRVDGQTETDRRMDGRTDRETDRHDETNSHFSQFCKPAWKLD